MEVHSSGATHCSARCCATGTLLLSLLPSLSDHELLEPGGEYLLRREKWVGRGARRGKGRGHAGSICVCQQRHWPGATEGRICSSVCPGSFKFCTTLQLHRSSCCTSQASHIAFLTKNPNWEERCCCCCCLEGLTPSPILSDCSFINSCHCCITMSRTAER